MFKAYNILGYHIDGCHQYADSGFIVPDMRCRRCHSKPPPAFAHCDGVPCSTCENAGLECELLPAHARLHKIKGTSHRLSFALANKSKAILLSLEKHVDLMTKNITIPSASFTYQHFRAQNGLPDMMVSKVQNLNTATALQAHF